MQGTAKYWTFQDEIPKDQNSKFPFEISYFSVLQYTFQPTATYINFSFKFIHLNWGSNICMSFKLLFFVDIITLVKKYLLLISFMALTVESLLKWGTLDLYLSSNVTHHSTGNKHHDRTLTYFRFSIHSTACHTAVLKVLPTFVAHIDSWG